MFFLPFSQAQSSWNQQGDDIVGNTNDALGSSVSMSADGTIIAVGASSANSSTGVVRVYEKSSGQWVQIGSDINGDNTSDSFGFSVSLNEDGSVLAVGANTSDIHFDDFSPSGYVKVYERNGSSWELKGAILSASSNSEFFGNSVSLSADGDVLAIGAPSSGGGSGAARLYKWSGTAWAQIGSDIIGTQSAEGLGTTLSISVSDTDSVLVVGSPSYESVADAFDNAGRVLVYRHSEGSWGGSWSSPDEMTGQPNDYFGWSVSISADMDKVAVGAPQDFFASDNYIGIAKVFDYDGANWSQMGDSIPSLKGDGTTIDADEFGKSVALSSDGSYIIIGAPGSVAEISPNGRAEVYSWSGTAWEIVGDSIPGVDESSSYGQSVAITANGSTVSIGAPADGSNANGLAQVFKFTLPNTAPVITADQSFSLDENAENDASVGTAVATDANEGTTFSSWTITAGNDDGVFAIDASTGEITVVDNTTLDFETTTSYTLTLTVSDGELTSALETITVNVVDIDEVAPTITSATTADFEENSTEVAYTAEANETVTFTLGSSKDEALFTLANDSEISFNEAPDFEAPQDANEDNTYLIDLIAADAAGNATTLEVTITVTDADEPATFTSAAAVNFVENSTAVAYTATTDETVTFSLGSSKDESFFILANNNKISFSAAPDFETPQDADADNAYVIDVMAEDAGGNITTLEVTITVTDVFFEYSGGLGTPSSPFLVSNKQDLKNLSENSSEWAYHYKQTADIVFEAADFATDGDFYNEGKGFKPIGLNDYQENMTFRGSYNGDGHIISGVRINNSGDYFQQVNYTGFFGLSRGHIYDLGLVNASVSSTVPNGYYVAILAGGSTGTIERCFVKGQVNGNAKGGIVAYHSGILKDSYAEVSFSDDNGGGLTNWGDGSIGNCYFISDGTVRYGLTNSYDYGPSQLVSSYYTGTQYGHRMTSANEYYTDQFRTELQLQDQATFEGWDFVDETENGTEDIWQMDNGCVNNGFPIFSWQENLSIPELTVSSPEPQCDETGTSIDFTLTATTTAGEISWYDAATDGNLLTTGGTYAISINETNSYWVEATNGLCTTGRVQVRATVLSQCLEGTGTANDPYLISNKTALLQISENPGLWAYHFKQEADITFEASDFEGKVFEPIGSIDHPYTASFDGGGHTISGLKVNQTEGNLAGMFGYVKNGVVKNLGLINSEVVSGLYAGGIVAVVDEATLDSVYFEGTVTATTAAGGLVGLGIGVSSISNSYFIGKVTGGVAAAGLASTAEGGSVNVHNSYAQGTVEGTRYVAGLAISVTTMTNSYAAVKLIGDEAETYAISYNGEVTNSYWDVEVSGIEESTVGTGLTTTEMKNQASFINWDFTDIWQMDNGCINDGYPIFAWQENLQPPTLTVDQTEYVYTDPDDVALVAVTGEGAVVRWYETGTSEEVLFEGSPFAPELRPGTYQYWVEAASGTCTSERIEVTVDIDYEFGGGDGSAENPFRIATKQDLKVLSEKSADWDKHFIQTADIIFEPADFQEGGDFYNGGYGFKPIGKFPGSYNGDGHKIANMEIYGNVTYSNAMFAWVTGDIMNLTIENISIENAGEYYVGGLTGYLGEENKTASITNCHVSGIIKSNNTSASVGGIAGESSYATIHQSSSNVDILNESIRIGGIVGGTSYSTITECFNEGHLNTTYNINSTSGGIVGWLWDENKIENCYNTGSVAAGLFAGNFSNGNSVKNSYNRGQTAGIGIGSNVPAPGSTPFVTITGSFWDIEASGITDGGNVGGIAGKNTAELKTLKTLIEASWDFTGESANGGGEIWQMDSETGYPIHAWSKEQDPLIFIEGSVVDENDEVFIEGEIRIKQNKDAAPEIVQISNDGSYYAEIFAAEHFVSVKPTSEDAYYQTYLGNTVQSASSTKHSGNKSGQNIKMIAKSQENLLNGEGKISGAVIEGENGGGRIVQGRILQGTPLVGVSVFLIRVSDEKIMTEVITDENGMFEINGIPNGEYQLVVNIDGVPVDLGNSTVTFDENESTLTVTAVVSEDGVELTIEKVLGTEDRVELSIYPNPATKFVNVIVTGKASIRIIDLKGTLITEKTFTNQVELNVEDLKESIYLMEIRNADGVSVRKLIKK